MPDEQPLQPATEWTDLIYEKDLVKEWGLSQNTLMRLRNREENPLPYVRLSNRVFYIRPQLVQWVNDEQTRLLPIERKRREILRKAAKGKLPG